MANKGVDAFQSHCQGFQDEESKTLTTEVMSKIKRLKVKGQKKGKNVSEETFHYYYMVKCIYWINGFFPSDAAFDTAPKRMNFRNSSKRALIPPSHFGKIILRIILGPMVV